MKNILVIMGSPRINMNTDKLVDYLIDGIDETEYNINKIYLRKKNIEYCTGCDYCGKTGECIKDDDMDLIYEGFDNSDIIIFAAPVYFNTINGLAKNMVDRCQKYWSIKYSLGGDYKRGEDRVGIFLSTGGAPYTPDQFDGVYPVLDYFFKAINAEHKGTYLISDTDNVQIKDRKDVQEELFQIGKNIGNFKAFTIQK